MPLHRVLEELASTDKLDLKVQVGHLPKWANLNIRIFHLVICCMVKTPKVVSNIIKEKIFEKMSCLLLNSYSKLQGRDMLRTKTKQNSKRKPNTVY